MNLQYISDNLGKVKAIQVQIPIEDWNRAKSSFSIPKEEILKEKKKMLAGIKKALNEVEQIEKGEIIPKTFERLLDEL